MCVLGLLGIAVTAYVKSAASSAGKRFGKNRKKRKADKKNAKLRAKSTEKRRILHPNGDVEYIKRTEERIAELPDGFEHVPSLELKQLTG